LILALMNSIATYLDIRREQDMPLNNITDVIDRKGLYIGFMENPDRIITIKNHFEEITFIEFLTLLEKVPQRMRNGILEEKDYETQANFL
jgi:hypothetical protein